MERRDEFVTSVASVGIGELGGGDGGTDCDGGGGDGEADGGGDGGVEN